MVGWIRAVGGCMRVGEIVENILKGGGTEKRGEEAKILKMGASCVKGWVSLKGGEGTGSPSRTMSCYLMKFQDITKFIAPSLWLPQSPYFFTLE